jgi:hypothetical protein
MTVLPHQSIADIDRQLPLGGEIFLDHVGHFVRDPAAAGRALRRLGFHATPVSIQVNPDPGGGEVPTGTGNITVMFHRGYVEALFKTADTPLGRELDSAIARYGGVHLAAFAVSDAAAAHRRLEIAGFRVRPLVEMQRPVETAEGPDVAAFTIARVEPGQMAEGRIQILTHRTERTVWQPRWLDHPNGATGLTDVVIVSSDAEEAGSRFSRFLDRPVAGNAFGQVVPLDRGRVQIVTPDAFAKLVPGLVIPSLPFIALYAIAVRSLDVLEGHLRSGGAVFVRDGESILTRFPTELGVGAWIFVERPAALPWRGS